MAKQTINLKELLANGSESFRRRNAHIQDDTSGTAHPKQKRGGRTALDQGSQVAEGMVNLPAQVLVRVVRYVPDRRHLQDDDNQVGGAKQLRDAIAALFCREGDSEADGLAWEYETRTGSFAVEIEVYEQ